MTPLERRVKIALGAGLTAPAIARLLRISVGEAKRIAAEVAPERMNTELARSRVQLGDPAFTDAIPSETIFVSSITDWLNAAYCTI